MPPARTARLPAALPFALVGVLLFWLAPAGRIDGATPDPVEISDANPHLVPVTADGQLPLLLEAASPYGGLVARIEELGGRVLYTYEYIEGLAATVPIDRLDALLADDRVRGVRRQRRLHRAIAPLGLPEVTAFAGRSLVGTPDRSGIEPLPVDPAAVRLVAVDPRGPGGVDAAGGPDVGPTTFLGYDRMTGAADVWETTEFGEGAIVAVIDTGIYPEHPMLAGSVVGGENLVPAAEEEEIDLDEDGVGDGRSFDWNALENNPHGTFVSGLIAGHGELLMPLDSPLVRSLAFHSAESVGQADSVTARISLYGTAPLASLYGIKVFPYDGGSAPDARVVEAVERCIELKESGKLDIDVINMSLSGPVLHDGFNPLDRMVDAATAAGITVVVAAANAGPSVGTVGTPASAVTSLAVGAAADPLHTRVAFELFFQGEPGTGNIVYRDDALQVIGFSSRGPTADGRVKPQILATGFLNYSSTVADLDQDGLPDTPFSGFGSGTSFSTPTVAGAAALLSALGEALGRHGRPPFVANVLTRAATPIAGYDEVSQLEQGSGFVQLSGAVELFERRRVWHGAALSRRNRLQRAVSLRRGAADGATPPLDAGMTYDFLVRVPPSAAQLEISFPAVTLADEQNPLLGDALEVAIHSAKRGGNGDYVFYAGAAEPGMSFVYDMPEPGTARITMAGSIGNYGPVSGSLEVRVVGVQLQPDRTFHGSLGLDEAREHVVDVPAGIAAMGVRLWWPRNWTRWPTRDLDLFLEHADTTVAAASLDSPEVALISEPPAGEWTARVADIMTVTPGREWYRLEFFFFDEPPIASLVGERSAAELRSAFAAALAVERDGGGPRGAGVVSSGAGAIVPVLLRLEPNPCNPSTEIRFELPASGPVAVRIYDVGGRLVRTLVDASLEAGAHRVRWDGATERGMAASSGVYFLRLEAIGGSTARKLVVAQ